MLCLSGASFLVGGPLGQLLGQIAVGRGHQAAFASWTRVTEIVASWHPGCDEAETERGNRSKNFTHNDWKWCYCIIRGQKFEDEK